MIDRKSGVLVLGLAGLVGCEGDDVDKRLPTSEEVDQIKGIQRKMEVWGPVASKVWDVANLGALEEEYEKEYVSGFFGDLPNMLTQYIEEDRIRIASGEDVWWAGMAHGAHTPGIKSDNKIDFAVDDELGVYAPGTEVTVHELAHIYFNDGHDKEIRALEEEVDDNPEAGAKLLDIAYLSEHKDIAFITGHFGTTIGGYTNTLTSTAVLNGFSAQYPDDCEYITNEQLEWSAQLSKDEYRSMIMDAYELGASGELENMEWDAIESRRGRELKDWAWPLEKFGVDYQELKNVFEDDGIWEGLYEQMHERAQLAWSEREKMREGKEPKEVMREVSGDSFRHMRR